MRPDDDVDYAMNQVARAHDQSGTDSQYLSGACDALRWVLAGDDNSDSFTGLLRRLDGIRRYGTPEEKKSVAERIRFLASKQ